MAAGNTDPVFKSLSAGDGSEQPTEIESLCMECGENVSKTASLYPKVASKYLSKSYEEKNANG